MKQIAKWAVLGIAAVAASATPGGAQFIAPACVFSVVASCDLPVNGAKMAALHTASRFGRHF